MQLNQLIENLEEFQQAIKGYRTLLLESGNLLVDKEKNHKKIEEIRSILNRKYASLQKYIQKFGQNPTMNDGVWNLFYGCYDNAFSADIIERVGPSIDCTLQDLDFILGTLSSMDDKEFNERMEDKKKIEVPQAVKKNYWNFVNPFWLIWQLLRFLWRHKIISGIAIGLAVAYLTYIFGWNN